MPKIEYLLEYVETEVFVLNVSILQLSVIYYRMRRFAMQDLENKKGCDLVIKIERIYNCLSREYQQSYLDEPAYTGIQLNGEEVALLYNILYSSL